MESDALNATDAQRCQRPFVFEPSEFALDCATPSVHLLPPLRLARDQRVEAVGGDPCRGGLALPGRTAPFRRAALATRPGELPGAVLALGRQVVAALYRRGLTQRRMKERRPAGRLLRR